jgi:hypothetical protein
MNAIDATNFSPAILRYRAGTTEQCLANPSVEVERQQIRVVHPGGSEEDVPFSLLKAVFFLPGDGGTPAEEEIEGSTLIVEFADGERIHGKSPEYNPARAGFFLYPADRTRNDRILVVTSAIVSIDVEKL